MLSTEKGFITLNPDFLNMYFDAHVHADVRSYEDYEAMVLAGIEKAVTCAHDVYRMTTSQVYLDHYDRLLRVETRLAARAGLDLYVALGVHPSAIPRDVEALLEALPEQLRAERVVAIGETGVELKDDRETVVLERQLSLAVELDMPIIVHTPRKMKEKAAEEALRLIDRSGIKPERVLLDHLKEESVEVAMDSGVYMGLTIQPPSKLTHEEAAELIARHGPERFIVSSDMSSIPSDPLALPRCALKLRAMDVSRKDVHRALYENAADFYGL